MSEQNKKDDRDSFADAIAAFAVIAIAVTSAVIWVSSH